MAALERRLVVSLPAPGPVLQFPQIALRERTAEHASRSEEDHRVLDVLRSKPAQRVQILGKNSQRPRVGTVEKLIVFVGERVVVIHQKTVSSSSFGHLTASSRGPQGTTRRARTTRAQGVMHMSGRSIGILGLALSAAVLGGPASAGQGAAAQPSKSGWQIPPEAETTKNPLTVDAKVLAAGKGVFKEKCQKCHGPAGKGDGPDADPDAQEDMDLTNPKRAARNTDGVVFFKVSNGRKKPKMPAQKDELTKEQIWAVVSYVQSLRKPTTP